VKPRGILHRCGYCREPGHTVLHCRVVPEWRRRVDWCGRCGRGRTIKDPCRCGREAGR
jgi:hypothetical protein